MNSLPSRDAGYRLTASVARARKIVARFQRMTQAMMGR